LIRFTWYRFIITSRISSGFTFCVILSWKIHSRNKMNCELMLTYDTPALRQTGSRNLTGQKTLPTIWGTYMKLVTKYQISAINSCWEKCDEKCAYMFNVYRNQLSQQKCDEKYLGWTKDGRTDVRTDRRTEVKQNTPLPLRGAGQINDSMYLSKIKYVFYRNKDMIFQCHMSGYFLWWFGARSDWSLQMTILVKLLTITV
jgi:hypothetical protein